MPRSLPIAVLTALCCWSAAGASPAWAAVGEPIETIDPATALAPSAQERRAVRGRSLPEVVEVPELLWLARVVASLPAGPSEPLEADQLPAWTRELALPEVEVPWSRTLLRLLQHLKEDRRGREATVGLLRRFGRHRAMVEEALAENGVPSLLAYAALLRSGLEPQASARDGAAGIWMLRADEARELGVQVDYWLDNRRDPREASAAVGRHLAALHDRLGSWPRALAAFHEGERDQPPRGLQVVDEATAPAAPAGEDVAATPGGRFVAFTFAMALIGENRAALGFDERLPLSAAAFDLSEVGGGITLATLARAGSTSAEVIRALNPALLRDRIPPDRDRLAVRLPPGAAGAVRSALAAALTAGDRLPTHRLRFGETLDDVAARLGVSPRELRKMNAVRDSWELRPRTVVVLPAAGSSNRAAAEEDLPEAEEPFVVGVPEGAGAVEGRTRVFYRTVEGDSVEELAQIFGVTADEIITWNSLDPLAQLQPRMVLQLHVPPELPREDVALVPAARVKLAALGSEEFHFLECARRGKSRVTVTARAGETLVNVARRFGLAPGDLARVNRYGWSNPLPEGQKVVIYSNSNAPREVVGRSQPARRPSAPVPKASAVGRTRQERGAQAARPPQNLPATKGGARPGALKAGAPKTANPNGAGRARRP